jgi:hypothetical protein
MGPDPLQFFCQYCNLEPILTPAKIYPWVCGIGDWEAMLRVTATHAGHGCGYLVGAGTLWVRVGYGLGVLTPPLIPVQWVCKPIYIVSSKILQRERDKDVNACTHARTNKRKAQALKSKGLRHIFVGGG